MNEITILGMKATINKIEKYKITLEKKTKKMLTKLASLGITVAQAEAKNDSHHFDKMVVFKKEWNGGYLYLIGRNKGLRGLHTEWYDAEGNYHTETISPILALEYGTAGKAIKGHKGSAAVTRNHVDDKAWYYYEGPNRTKPHKATAEEAHEPMYKAFLIMKKQIQLAASEVFGNDG